MQHICHRIHGQAGCVRCTDASAVTRRFHFCSNAAGGWGLAFAASVLACCAHAAPLANAQRMIGYAVIDQDVGQVVSGIATQIGLRADVSGKLRGRVHGRMTSSTAEATLSSLGAVYGFDWYSDGQTLYVSTFGEAVRRVLPLGAVSGAELLATMDALGVADPRWPIRMSASQDVALVNGPPHYVSLVEETLGALAQRTRAGAAEVHIFRGASGS